MYIHCVLDEGHILHICVFHAQLKGRAHVRIILSFDPRSPLPIASAWSPLSRLVCVNWTVSCSLGLPAPDALLDKCVGVERASFYVAPLLQWFVWSVGRAHSETEFTATVVAAPFCWKQPKVRFEFMDRRPLRLCFFLLSFWLSSLRLESRDRIWHI